jgi:hypothetical protein
LSEFFLVRRPHCLVKIHDVRVGLRYKRYRILDLLLQLKLVVVEDFPRNIQRD